MQAVQIEWTRVPGVQAALPEDALRTLYATASIDLDIRPAANALTFDPAQQPGGYQALEQQLRPAPNVIAPGVMILGQRPKSGDPTVLGETFGNTHGLGAVYLANLVDATGVLDSRQLLHTAAHEIGHLCNLAHGFAAISAFSSVMVPARFRSTPLAAAWMSARQEASSHNDTSWIEPPPEVASYPFNIVCRQRLTFQPSVLWRPWVGDFAGGGEGPDTTHDQGVVLSAHPHRTSCVVGDDLAFDLELISQHGAPLVLPLNLHPDFGTLEVTVEEPSGLLRRYSPGSHQCSDSTWLLRQRERRLSPLSLLADRDGPLLRQAGRHAVTVRLRIPGVPVAANAGECRFEVVVRDAPRRAPMREALRRMSPRRKVSLLARAKDGQDLGVLHHACLHNLNAHPDLIALAESPGAPRAVRHSAALRRAAEAPSEQRQAVVEALVDKCVTAHDSVLRYKLMHFIHRKEQP